MIENKTKYDLEVQKVANKPAVKMVLITVGILALAFIVAGIFKLKSELEIGIGFILGGIIVFLVFFFKYEKMLLKNITKGNKQLSENSYQYYCFMDDNIKIEFEKDNKIIGSSLLKYSDVFKVKEIDGYFLIYISKVQMYIVRKSSMVSGSVDDVRKIMKDNVTNYK